MLLVVVFNAVSTTTPNTVSIPSGPSFVQAAAVAASGRALSFWRLLAPPTGNQTIRMSATSGFNGGIAYIPMQNVHQTVPTGLNAGVVSSGTTNGLTLNTGNTGNDLVFSCIGLTPLPTADAQMVVLARQTVTGGSMNPAWEPGPSPNTLTWTWTGTNTFAHLILQIKGSPETTVSLSPATASIVAATPTIALMTRIPVAVSVVLTPDQSKEVHVEV